MPPQTSTHKRPLITIISILLTLTVGTSIVFADSGPPWAGTTLDDLAYTEQQGWTNLDSNVTITSDTNDFTDGHVEVHITNATASDGLRLVDGGLITVVGDAVYYNGDRIGTIDNSFDGSGGRLRINFSSIAPLWNADFEEGDLTGWSVDTGYTGVTGQSWVESPGDDPDVPPANVDSDPLIDDHCYGSCTYGPVTQSATVQSTEVFEKTYALQLTISGTVLAGYGTAHGPTVTSGTFTAAAGDSISLNWNAQAGGDWFDVYGFVFRDDNVNGIWDGGEDFQKLFHDVGANTGGWITTTTPVNGTVAGENMRFYFLNGNYDRTGGRAIGSSLYIDGIVVQLSSIVVATDVIVKNIVENIQYQNTSDDPATPKNYNLNFLESDSGTGFNSAQINITGQNDPPTDIGLSNNSVDENQVVGTSVGTFSTSDPESGDSHTYTLVSGTGDTDNASFSISGTTLQTGAIFDFETKSSYSIRVQTDDGNGGTYQEAFTITINDTNDPPTDIGLSSADVDENQASGTAVGTLSTTDPDSVSHTYTLVAGTGDTDNASFSISGSTLQTAATFDFVTKSSYSIRVQTDDGNGGTYQEAFTITINDTNDAPTDIGLSSADVDENQTVGTAVGTLSTTDSDSGDSHTYTLVAGTGDADNASFSILGTTLQTGAFFNFESKSSYSIRVQTDDGNGGTFQEVFTITINDTNDAPTDIGLSSADVDENQSIGTAVGTLSTTDPDSGASHTYTLVSGTGDTDNASFSMSGGTLQTAGMFDYETKSTYSIRVQTDDGNGGTYQEAFTITINDINDAPTDIGLSSSIVDEKQPIGTAVGTLSTTDQDSASHTYTLVAGAGSVDNGSFTISGSTLQTAGIFDFETKSSYSIRVQTDDGSGGTYQEVITITINDLNDVPTDIALSSTNVNEKQTVGTAVGTLSTTDQDSGDSHTYTLVAGTGDTDNASFGISGNTLQTAEVFDFEVKDTYTIRVQTDDGNGGTFQKVFTITINDLDEGHVKLICSGGGNVRLGNWSLTIPPGALTHCSIVNIIPKSPADGPDVPDTIERLDHTVDIIATERNGDPITTFKRTANLCYDYNTNDLYQAQYNPNIMIIGVFRNDQSFWDTLVTLASSARGEICTSIDHLSLYDIFVPLTPETGFAHDSITELPLQPVDKSYQQMSSLSLEVPSLGITMPIVGVPITDSGWDVTWLENRVGYLEGTAFPSWPGNTVLTAHVWSANNQPGPFLGIKDLMYGDIVKIHAWGMVYNYEVKTNYRVWPNNSSVMRHEEYDWVTLLTCESFSEYTESYRYRRAVRAVLISVTPE